jgi:predicted dehydrogenase
VTRRQFLARAAALGLTAAGATGMSAWPARAQSRRISANETIVTGHIGIGGMGGGHLGGFAHNPRCRVAAVCDVQEERRNHAAEVVAEAGGRADAYDDFRRVLERDDIDAVVIATPDHWHALTTITACEAGKDVYCEKPMTLTIEEGQAMIRTARRYGRIVQIGTQQRSQEHIRHAVCLVRSGRIGKVTLARTWFGGGGGGGYPPDEPVPPGLDWEMWLGPAPWRPYNPARFSNFRMFTDYSGGRLTDWGTHLIDIIHWGTGEDAPVSIEAKGRMSTDGCYEMPETLEITYEYPTFTMIWSQPPPDPLPMGIPDYGMYFEGTEGRLFVDREKYIIEPEEADAEPLGPGDFTLPPSKGHSGEWLDCIVTRELPVSDVAVGHRSTSAPHLGNLAFRLGRKLNWDREAERFIGDDEANRMLSKPYRAPWHLA